MIKRYQVTRDVADSHPNNWAGRDVRKGEVFDEFNGVTYGSCNQIDGVVLESEHGSFFEFPRDAVAVVEPPPCGGVAGYVNGITEPEQEWQNVMIGPGGITLNQGPQAEWDE